MSVARKTLLWASENDWLKTNVPKWKFVQKALKKFMPGESSDDAITESLKFLAYNIPTVFTKLGENISNIEESFAGRDHYIAVIDQIADQKLDTEISLKLTQIGFDISEEEAFNNFCAIAERVKTKLGNTLFIDMEGSAYTQRTIDFYKRVIPIYPNTGICLQAYLYRTVNDINELINCSPKIRLVKGAYRESGDIAYPDKNDVDKNYFELSKILLRSIKENNVRTVFATHDSRMIEEIISEGLRHGLSKSSIEFQMLYGIKTNYQYDLAKRGFSFRVLIAYGEYWYPWYMRRLAERPANVWFVVKNFHKK